MFEIIKMRLIVRVFRVLIGRVEESSFDPPHRFATVEVMKQYGYLLEQFKSNSELTNEALFTMMHHVSGDLGSPEALFVPQILAKFASMWEQMDTEEMCEDWSDLIEYVMHKFITTMATKPHACASKMLGIQGVIGSAEAMDENGFTKSQLDSLEWYYSRCENADDIVGAIIVLYRNTFNVTKTRLSVYKDMICLKRVEPPRMHRQTIYLFMDFSLMARLIIYFPPQIIQALLSKGIITFAQYMSLMYMKSVVGLLLWACKMLN